jgi:hypothetical protein
MITTENPQTNFDSVPSERLDFYAPTQNQHEMTLAQQIEAARRVINEISRPTNLGEIYDDSATSPNVMFPESGNNDVQNAEVTALMAYRARRRQDAMLASGQEFWSKESYSNQQFGIASW